MLEKMSHLNQRLAVGLAVVCLILTAIYFSPYPYFRPFFALIASAIIGGAVWELYIMSKSKGVRPLESLGILGSVIYVVSVFWSTQSGSVLLPGSVLAGLLFLSFLHFFFRQGCILFDLSVTYFAIGYLTIPLAFLVNINYYFASDSPQDGRWWLIFLILVSKLTDTGAFFCGRYFGRTKMAPEISPKKTWEGAIGGTLLAMTAAALYYVVTDHLQWQEMHGQFFWSILPLSFVLSVFAQFGDLSESMLKRDAGFKDSNQLPGLGGVLDIVDSLVFTTPILYIFLKLMYP
jgi:phosphatidate cytidylyltransferase